MRARLLAMHLTLLFQCFGRDLEAEADPANVALRTLRAILDYLSEHRELYRLASSVRSATRLDRHHLSPRRAGAGRHISIDADSVPVRVSSVTVMARVLSGRARNTCASAMTGVRCAVTAPAR